MDPRIERALSRGHTIDITTTGRTSGQPRRIEIVFHNFDGRLYITGLPRADRRRAWLRNLEQDPRMTVHLKRTVEADLPARARIITDEAERRAVFDRVVAVWPRQDVETMTRHSPLIEVVLEDAAA